MNAVSDAIRKAARLETLLDTLRHEVAELRHELEQLQGTLPAASEGTLQVDCLATAVALAQDLGADFSSAALHELACRGEAWLEAS